MKKIMIATLVATAFVAPQAFAQAKSFEGFSLIGNLNFNSSTTDVSSTIFTGSSTESDQTLALQGQYNFALNDTYVLGLGLGLNLGEMKAGTMSVLGTTVTVKQKTGSSFLAPGMVLNNSMLVYGKLASVSGNFEATGTSVTTSTVSGVGYGVGLQNYFNKNLFVQGEVMQNNYADRSFAAFNEVDKNKSTVLSIGVGYKF